MPRLEPTPIRTPIDPLAAEPRPGGAAKEIAIPSSNDVVARLRSDRPERLGLALAWLLAAAGGLHLAALPGHLPDPAAGLFFAATALGQFLGAVLLLLRPTRRTTAAIIAGNLLVLAIWALSRTTGLPIGGDLGTPEPVTMLDSLAAAAEMLIVAGGLAVVLRRSPAGVRQRGGWQPALALGVTWLVSGALATGLIAPHHHGHDHEARSGAPATAWVSGSPIPPADQLSPAPAPVVSPASAVDASASHPHSQACRDSHRCAPDHHHDDH